MTAVARWSRSASDSSAGEYFIPELILAGEMLKSISAEVKPYMTGATAEAKKGARVLVGTVKGDIHDIGKDIVVFMLDVNGFEVKDLGIDVPVETFVETIRDWQPAVVALSGFLTLSYDAMKETVDRDQGGRPARQRQDHGRRRHGGPAGVRVRGGRCLRPGRDGRGDPGQAVDCADRRSELTWQLTIDSTPASPTNSFWPNARSALRTR